jgi:crotonobetainyl-CoA:carnitine CoA-transferase CaiB-like acyl-CoA transferase
MLGLQNEREWQQFCTKVLQQPELEKDERFTGNANRVKHREALRTLIVGAFASLTAAQVLERVEDAQIANAQVNDMAGLWAHGQLKARSRWREVGSPVGPLPALLPPGSWDDGEPVLQPVPALGAHSDAILAELGLDAAGIAALRAAQAV